MRILLVKLGAMGDVLRTTPLLAAYKRIYPDALLTWVVDAESAPILQDNPLIDRLLVYSAETLKFLSLEDFDLALNLDKEKEALHAVEIARAGVKKGFGWNADKSGLVPLNPASEYAVRLGIDDKLKFRANRKTYQEISFGQAELPYSGEEYVLNLPEDDKRTAVGHLERLGLRPAEARECVGVNTGSGDRFAGKRLPIPHLVELSRMLSQFLGRKTVLLGGPNERDRNKQIEREAQPCAVDGGTYHSIKAFAALVSCLGLVITGDTITMHAAIATRVPLLVYFGSTCEAEIELYGRGKKIISPLDCAPCYKKVCPRGEKCMSDLSMRQIVAQAGAMLGSRARIPR